MFVKSIGKSAGRIGKSAGRIGHHAPDGHADSSASLSGIAIFLVPIHMGLVRDLHECVPRALDDSTLFLESGFQVGLQIWISQSGKKSTNILVLFKILALEVVESCGHLPCAEDWGETLAPAHDTIPIMCAMGPKPM